MKKIALALISVLGLIGCSHEDGVEDQKNIYYPPNYVLTYGEKMFTDFEKDTILYSDSARGYNCHEMLRYKPHDATHYRLFNAVPHDFRDVSIYCKVDTIEKEFMIAHFDLVPQHHCMVGTYPGLDKKTTFTTMNGQRIELGPFHQVETEHVSFRVTCPDPLFFMLQKIRQVTRIKFSRYGKGNWGVLTPRDARYYTFAFTNMAYLYSSKRFEKAFKNYEGNLYDNNKNPIDRNKVYESMINKKLLNLGVVTGSGIGGLGGGAAFGVRSEYITKYAESNNNWPLEVYGHEFSHTIGFGHSSNLTYANESKGLVPILQKVYTEMYADKDLPFIGDPFAVEADPFIEKKNSIININMEI
ncbi:hypothetical protein K5X82_03335 [Halosquirtibacter xylanolyticus]|uniref:hypothetical protein n=1 Tax=Halosquirtibacter xylanolyticus TaxID=3374599 RepID=UPI0037494938|nr:hypothetical protein K5X82_03335 [Prolixibacteraceae bacterium]